MNPTLVIESDMTMLSGPPREILCSVWPVSKSGDELIIGEPILSNHMVLVGASTNDKSNSTLTLPEAGVYLVDVGYPSGQSLRTTISVREGQKYSLAVEIQKQAPLISLKMKSVSRRVPVVSSALKPRGKKLAGLEVSVIDQPNPVPLSDLYDFALNLKRDNNFYEAIFSHPASTEHTHEVPLTTQSVDLMNAWEHIHVRKWIMVEREGKPQTLLSYPYGWNCENSPSFKLMMERRYKDNRWPDSLKLMDPVYGSLVEYLTRRDLMSTRSISDSQRGQAATALYKKMGNPFAAAAAAYVFALTRDEDPEHHRWMKTLSSRYFWLPDGAIALGWKILCEGQNDLNAWKEARRLFSLAFSRGLPYYTIGLHVLVDALTLLRRIDPDDKDVLEMLAVAKAADVACVRTESFTTLQISRYLGLPMQQA